MEKQLIEDINNNKYRIVKIGNQIWMADNLNVSTYQNGDPIFQSNNSEEFFKAAEESKGTWCYYGFDSKNEQKHGKLYNWHAVNDSRGLAPVGFCIPTVEQWDKLAEHLRGGLHGSMIGDKLKIKDSKDLGIEGFNGTNESGFNGMPSGWLYPGNYEEWPGCECLNTDAFWWTASQGDDEDTAFCRHINCKASSDLGPFCSGGDKKKGGISVRCVEM